MQHTGPGVVIWVDKDLNKFYRDFYQRRGEPSV